MVKSGLILFDHLMLLIHLSFFMLLFQVLLPSFQNLSKLNAFMVFLVKLLVHFLQHHHLGQFNFINAQSFFQSLFKVIFSSVFKAIISNYHHLHQIIT